LFDAGFPDLIGQPRAPYAETAAFPVVFALFYALCDEPAAFFVPKCVQQRIFLSMLAN
jgi:hypothetical protein